MVGQRLSNDDVLAELRAAGALLEGHFRLTSGLHSPVYLQCARLLMDPRRAERLVASLVGRIVDRLGRDAVDIVVAPAMGGVVFGYELARQLGVSSIFTERVDGTFRLRRGFSIEPGSRVLIAEDVITTGLSSRECIECVGENGGDVMAEVCLIDRSGGTVDLGVPVVALAALDLPVYREDELPAALAAIPAVKPGSRGLTKA